MKISQNFPRIYAIRRPALVLPLLVFFIVATILFSIAEMYRQSMISENRASLRASTDEISSFLSSRINARYALLDALSAMVIIHLEEGLQQDHFSTYARGLQGSDPVFRAIEFFPTEGSLLVYPLEGNENIAGDTLDDLRTTVYAGIGQDVERAISSREVTLSDPYELLQGGTGIVARKAVFDGDEFLGVAAIILDPQHLLAVPGLVPARPGVRFAIRDTEGRVFFGDETVFGEDPVQSTIPLPEGSWMLGAAPVGGWEAGHFSRMALAWAVSLAMASLSGFAVYLNTTHQLRLKNAVDEQTAALRESEARYFQTFKVINEGVWDWDIEKGTGFASDSFFSIIGAENPSFNGFSSLMEYFHADDRARVGEQVEGGIESGKGFDIQARLAQKSGNQETHVLIRGRVVKSGADGRALRMLGTISDVTEQVRAEEEQRESEAVFRAIFHNNHAVMLLLDPETGAIIDANPAACGFFGYTQAEMKSLHIQDINTLNDEEIKEELEMAMNETRAFFNFRHRLSTGEIRDVEVFSGPITHAGRKLLFSIIHDVTARKKAEKALMENENRLRFALEGANDGLWVVGLQSRDMFMSPRGCDILGYSENEFPQMVHTWEELLHPEDAAEASAKYHEYINGQAEIYECEARMKTRQGGWKWVLMRGKSLDRAENGEVLSMTGTLTDISQRKQDEVRMRDTQRELKRLLTEAEASRRVLLSMLEDQKAIEEKLNQANLSLEQRVRERTVQLETINNELEAFSYSVSHDLRAPLRGIDGWSMALLEDYGGQLDENAHGYLTRVRSETQRMGDLIDDLLRLSRVTRMELIRGEIDLSEAARQVSERIREEYQKNPPEFVIEPGINAQGDAQLIDIVLTNLLSNACKFSAIRPSPRVEFGQTRISDSTAYFVRDNGVGFDSANAKKLFGAFQRMHRQSDFPGTGIGLATVKRIINRHGGQVWAEAKKDQGATFYFTLPEV